MPHAATPDVFDIAIIGGGINGCGIARDAAGRGWSVFLCEASDLASGTSSASTKLVHGGLRYLEHYEFRLVREALMEREVLWGIAPHIVWPLRFVLPHHKGLRPAWLLRLGLFLYDHIGGRKRLPPTRTVRLRQDPAGRMLKPRIHARIRVFGWLGRGFPHGGAECAGRGGARRHRAHAHALRRRGPSRGAVAAAGPARQRRGAGRPGAGAGQRGRPPGSARCCRRWCTPPRRRGSAW